MCIIAISHQQKHSKCAGGHVLQALSSSSSSSPPMPWHSYDKNHLGTWSHQASARTSEIKNNLYNDNKAKHD